MDYRQIVKRIRNIRKSKGLTQECLAELADISLTHMSLIETGTIEFSLPILIKISETLRVSTDELLSAISRQPKTLLKIIFRMC